MEILKIVILFLMIVLILRLRKPLWLAFVFASAGTILLYHLDLQTAGRAIARGMVGTETLSVLIAFYLVTFLQRMLEIHGCMKLSREALDGLFHNRRINASVASSVFGLLPAVTTVLICGEMVRESTDGFLKKDEQAFITSYYRHVPELFLPTYTSTLIAVSLAEGKVNISSFVIAMFPMVFFLMAAGWLFYLRKIPKRTERFQEQKSSLHYCGVLFRNLWTMGLTIIMILALHLQVYAAVLICVILNVFVEKFSPAELKKIAVSAFEGKMLLSTALIMVFKELLTSAGALEGVQGQISGLVLPPFLIFAILFFLGTIISGSQAIIVMCMPMAMAASSGSGLAMFVLLMSMTYAAMQISPTHICLFVCADDFRISFSALIKKTVPVIFLFICFAFMYYGVLSSFGF